MWKGNRVANGYLARGGRRDFNATPKASPSHKVES